MSHCMSAICLMSRSSLTAVKSTNRYRQRESWSGHLLRKVRTLTHIIGPKVGHRYAPESLADIMQRMQQAATSAGQLDVPARSPLANEDTAIQPHALGASIATHSALARLSYRWGRSVIMASSIFKPKISPVSKSRRKYLGLPGLLENRHH